MKKKNKIYTNIKRKKYHYKWRYCSVCEKRTTSSKNGIPICPKCQMGLEDKVSDEEKALFLDLKKSKMTLEEIRLLVRNGGSKNETVSIQPYTVKQSKLRIGVFGDTHIGSKFYDPQLMKYAAEVFNKEKVDFVIHTGDICEGHYESKRAGSVFELTEVGGDNQVDRAAKELRQIKRPIYVITGNHEHNTFYKLCGFDVGVHIAEKVPNMTYLGNMHATIKLPYGKKIEILHPGGGSSYALSYRPQKIVESLEGGSKPDILLIGHYHKMLQMYYRNVHTFMTGTLQSQSSFMREHGLAAHKGFYILNIEVGKNGISKLTTEQFTAY